jgi:hypothetical protein
MKWGETQNLLSVIIGLNIAYYAFKELRAPHLTDLKRRAEELESDLVKRMNDLKEAGDKIPAGAQLNLALVKAWLPIISLRRVAWPQSCDHRERVGRLGNQAALQMLRKEPCLNVPAARQAGLVVG